MSDPDASPSIAPEDPVGDTPAAIFVDLTKAIKHQTEVMEQLMAEKQGQTASADTKRASLSQEILDVLREMRDKQNALEFAKYQSAPTQPATSATAWSALLRSHQNTVQPVVDRWRGSLDTLLVFIALFSAIVTTFFVQSLDGLAQDPGDRTNELLQNLTSIVLSIGHGNLSMLTIDEPQTFEPEASAVRLNFYWSIALILSISVAALAVTSRGYLSMIARTRETKAHKKLGDLYRRWGEAERLLGPAVETLPQLLMLPVVLFVVGLLDNLISSSIPLSRPFTLVFVAGILSAIFAVIVGAYTIWTVAHGCLYPTTSPFQSTLSRLILRRNEFIPFMRRHLKDWCIRIIPFMKQSLRSLVPRIMSFIRQNAAFAISHMIHIIKYYRHKLYVIVVLWMEAFAGFWIELLKLRSSRTNGIIDQEMTWMSNTVRPDAQTMTVASLAHDEIKLDDGLLEHEVNAFHAVLKQTHEDETLDQAILALPSILINYPSEGKKVSIREEWGSTAPEVCSITYMLSSEASIRSNMTAARFIAGYEGVHKYSGQDCIDLMMLLFRSAEHYSILTTGQRCASVLWDSPFLAAMARISYSLREAPGDNPVIGILLWIILRQSKDVNSLWSPSWMRTLTLFLCHILHSRLINRGGKGKISQNMIQNATSIQVTIKELTCSWFYNIALIENLIKFGATIDDSKDKAALQAYCIFFHYVIKSKIEQIDVVIELSTACERIILDIMRPGPNSGATYMIRAKYMWLRHLLPELHVSLSRLSDQHIELLSYSNRNWGNIADAINMFSHFVYDCGRRPCSAHILNRLVFSNPMDMTTHVVPAEHHQCTLLCEFQALVQSSIKMIHQKFPELRLSRDNWNMLAKKLTSREFDYELLATSQEHRNVVKQNFVKAFEVFSPVASDEARSDSAEFLNNLNFMDVDFGLLAYAEILGQL